MKKKLLITCAVLLCAMGLAACGKDTSEDARSGSGKENTEQERDEGTADVTSEDIQESSADDHVDRSNDNDEQKTEFNVVYPITVKLLDEKHVDFIFDPSDFVGKDIGADNIVEFIISFPTSECEIWYEGDMPLEAGSSEIMEAHAHGNFEGAHAALGEMSFEIVDDCKFILHLDMTDGDLAEVGLMASDGDTCLMTCYLWDDENEYSEEYVFADIVDRSEYQERYADVLASSAENEPDTGDGEFGGHIGSDDAPGSSITMDYFVGDYIGINPYFVVDWETYEMSEEVNHSTMTLEKTSDGYVLKDIIIDSKKSPKAYFELDAITFRPSDMVYELDDGQKELWDCLDAVTDYGDIIFSRRQIDGQIVIGWQVDGVPFMFIKKK